jgi:hypothetical protein
MMHIWRITAFRAEDRTEGYTEISEAAISSRLMKLMKEFHVSAPYAENALEIGFEKS